MKVYVAGPMQGIPHFNFPAFNAIALALRAKGHEVFNPAEKDIERMDGHDPSKGNTTGDLTEAEKKGFSLRDALADDTQWICKQADALFMLLGWEHSKGARAEHALATALGHVIFYQRSGDGDLAL